MNNNIYNMYSQLNGTNYSDILMSYQTPIDYLTVRLLSKSIKSIWRIDILFTIIDNILNVNLDSYGLNITMLRRIFGNNTLEYMLSGSMLLQTLMGSRFNSHSNVDIYVTKPDNHNSRLKQIISDYFISNGFCPLYNLLNRPSVLSFVHMSKNQDIFETECPNITWDQLRNTAGRQRAFLRLSEENGVNLSKFYTECSMIQIYLTRANGPEIIDSVDFTILQSFYSLSTYHRLEISNEEDIRSRNFAGTNYLFSRLHTTYTERSIYLLTYSNCWINEYYRFHKYQSYGIFHYRGAVDIPTQTLYEDTITLFGDYINTDEQLPN